MQQILLLNIFTIIVSLIFIQSGVCNKNASVSTSKFLNSREVPDGEVSIVQSILFPSNNDTRSTALNNIPSYIEGSRNTFASSSQAQDTDFKPSIHLGEMKNPCVHQVKKAQSIPFNHVSHIQFDNSVNVEPDKATMVLHPQPSTTNPVKFYPDTDSRYVASTTVEHPDSHNPYHHGYQEGYMSIDAAPQVTHVSPHQTPQPASVHYEVEQPHPHQHQHPHHYAESPTLQTVYTKPVKYEPAEPVQYHYTYASPATHEDVGNYHEPPSSSFQSYYLHPSQHETPEFYNGELINHKPGTVVYVTSHRQTSITKTRKFPYKFYQPLGGTGFPTVEQEHAFPPQPKPVSPWHKILHLIGAFLPLGLLIAALKPPIIKIDGNNTKPDIVLSKFRPINLPLEHRSLEESEEETCENKSICELILQGANENADFAHKLLWNFSIRWTEEEARRNGLEDLFKAVKKKNCSTIKC